MKLIQAIGGKLGILNPAKVMMPIMQVNPSEKSRRYNVKIYDAYAYDGDYYDPLHPIGIYNNFEIAKQSAVEQAENTDTLHVDVLELVGNKFEIKERWSRGTESTEDWELEE